MNGGEVELNNLQSSTIMILGMVEGVGWRGGWVVVAKLSAQQNSVHPSWLAGGAGGVGGGDEWLVNPALWHLFFQIQFVENFLTYFRLRHPKKLFFLLYGVLHTTETEFSNSVFRYFCEIEIKYTAVVHTLLFLSLALVGF